MNTVRRLVTFCSLIIPLFGMISCTNTNQPAANTTAKTSPEKEIAIPSFNADSAYLFVKQQVDFGPRVCSNQAHEKCASYLAEKLRSYNAKVVVQEGQVTTFNAKTLKIKNIIGSYNLANKNRILICSHWDSRPFADHDPDPKKHNTPIDGANDGASGVGVILEIARQVNLSSPSIGIDLIFFDAEDYGPPQDQMLGQDTENWWGLGTQYWARNPHVAGYTARYGILLDMVGAANATFLAEANSMQYASAVVRNVWNTATNIGYSDFFIFEPGGAITDDHLFINRILNLPTIDIIHLDRKTQTGFYPYWHTVKDNMNAIDRNTLLAVGQTLLTVIYREQN